MISKIEELESGLRAQLSSLANDIKSAELALMTTKEGYLKVQGALEILDILKKNVEPKAIEKSELDNAAE